MAKRKQDQEEFKAEDQLAHNAFQSEPVKVADPSHLEPQKEMDGPPERPKAVKPEHLKPQE